MEVLTSELLSTLKLSRPVKSLPLSPVLSVKSPCHPSTSGPFFFSLEVLDVAYSRDGTMLASGFDDSIVRTKNSESN